jgi:hypothetical protein
VRRERRAGERDARAARDNTREPAGAVAVAAACLLACGGGRARREGAVVLRFPVLPVLPLERGGCWRRRRVDGGWRAHTLPEHLRCCGCCYSKAPMSVATWSCISAAVSV